MNELNDLPESAVAGLDAVEPQSDGPHDAPWPDDTAPTGDAAVDSALERLAGFSSVPVAEHNGMYAGIHDSLLAALDAEER